jgi:hypothetical protein
VTYVRIARKIILIVWLALVSFQIYQIDTAAWTACGASWAVSGFKFTGSPEMMFFCPQSLHNLW